MTPTDAKPLWTEITILTASAGWIMRWIEAGGPLDDKPTADPAVQVLLSARRHLLKKANRLRRKVLA